MVIVRIYRSRKPLGRQKWRWQAIADNGRIVANSGEAAYTNRVDCQRMVVELFHGIHKVVGGE